MIVRWRIIVIYVILFSKVVLTIVYVSSSKKQLFMFRLGYML